MQTLQDIKSTVSRNVIYADSIIPCLHFWISSACTKEFCAAFKKILILPPWAVHVGIIASSVPCPSPSRWFMPLTAVIICAKCVGDWLRLSLNITSPSRDLHYQSPDHLLSGCMCVVLQTQSLLSASETIKGYGSNYCNPMDRNGTLVDWHVPLLLSVCLHVWMTGLCSYARDTESVLLSETGSGILNASHWKQLTLLHCWRKVHLFCKETTAYRREAFWTSDAGQKWLILLLPSSILVAHSFSTSVLWHMGVPQIVCRCAMGVYYWGHWGLWASHQ